MFLSVMGYNAAALFGFAVPSLFAIAASVPADIPPRVDLGYAIHQASLNFTNNPYPYYNFSNIRYGQAPVGELRWKAPLPINAHDRNQTVNEGQTGVIPTQVKPVWYGLEQPFLTKWLADEEFADPAIFNSAVSNFTVPAPDPQKIFKSTDRKAPVLVWIHGGGYAFGDKTSEGNPATFIAKSELNGADGVVFVSINYRLGLFGWLSGDDNVTANVGLLDQRLALEWVQENIHRFGGDPSRVTVMGESAGGGSIMHHITSYGGKGSTPLFHQAIIQSPAFQPFVPQQSKILFDWVLGNASAVANKQITSAQDLRALSFEELRAVNALMVGKSPYGRLTFGPVVDPSPNSYVPDFPIRLISQKKFHDVPVMVSQTAHEGRVFTPPFDYSEDQNMREIQELFPTANSSVIEEISQTLYPQVYDGTHGYKNKIERSNTVISDLLVGCNAYYLSKTLSRAYGYVFDIEPKVHAEDVDWQFDNGDIEEDVAGITIDHTIADAMQKYITAFAMGGVPVAEGLPTFSEYGKNYTVSDITDVFDDEEYENLGRHVRDPAARPQCNFWAAAPFYDAGSS
ncbi:related to para-nitrobenzyl esterase [Phialocephala subalpina]|uniref:Carboxylic ester hydrolase n=1 Tax=Phialocephala subalpina TaxID=576137 RepID=A0A1L7XV43_9HELO|nr:related to para-nitrobenzyl esterase [Phialocephala subalpina]